MTGCTGDGRAEKPRVKPEADTSRKPLPLLGGGGARTRGEGHTGVQDELAGLEATPGNPPKEKGGGERSTL